MKIFVVGSINMDLVIKSPVMPDNGVTLTGSDFMMNPGGKGANQAVAVSKLGGESYMVGCLGDAFSRDLKETLEGYNVKTDYIVKKDNVSSGIAVIIIVDGDNRIILDAGSNALVDKDAVDNAFSKASEGDYVICQLEIPQETVRYAFLKAKKLKMKTILNPAPASKLIDGILENTDYFIPNENETEMYTGIKPDTKENQILAIKKLNEMGVKNIVITLGTNGSSTIENNEYIHVDSYKVKAIDTTAAGDTFIGALTVELSRGRKLKDAMDFASKASSITVTRNGAQKSIPYRNELE